jgi:Transposase IS66 family
MHHRPIIPSSAFFVGFAKKTGLLNHNSANCSDDAGLKPIWAASRVLQVDGYAGYRKLADRGDVRLAFCWSHVRRNFYESPPPDPRRSPARRSNILLRSTP